MCAFEFHSLEQKAILMCGVHAGFVAGSILGCKSTVAPNAHIKAMSAMERVAVCFGSPPSS